MTQYDDTNRGFLRTNEKKSEQKEGAPGYRGQINVNGEEFWLSAWISEHENMGGKYFQIKAEPKEKVFEDAKQAAQEPVQQGGGGGLDDEIPFARHLDFIGG